MGLKDLLVHVDGTADSPTRLGLAADLASRHGARLIALYAKEWSDEQWSERGLAEMGLASAKEVGRLDERIEASIAREAERVGSIVDALGRERGLVTEWRCLAGSASKLVPQHARCADLCVVGHKKAGDDSEGYSFSETLMFTTGRPVLFVPPACPNVTLGRRIAVAWNSSRPAARAVNDAMPLIERAEQTTVITVNSADYIDRYGALPTDYIVENLGRHGASIDLVQLDGVPKWSIGDTVQAKARELGADLLVAGAFGHPKLWEKLLGGVTRDLLDRTCLPILMSC